MKGDRKVRTRIDYCIEKRRRRYRVVPEELWESKLLGDQWRPAIWFDIKYFRTLKAAEEYADEVRRENLDLELQAAAAGPSRAAEEAKWVTA
ncbi:MAG: hypothetical protein ACM3UO_00080 [Bacillota bacterium]